MPYYSQSVSSDLIDDIVRGNTLAQNDPRWKESGATSKEEYAIWAHNGCGMACLKMILEKKLSKKIPLVKLGKTCKKYGGYTDNKKAQQNNDYTNYYKGLFYKPFVTFIRKEYQINGHVLSPLIQKEIIQALDNQKFAVTSVHPDIKTPTRAPKGKGGHLVLVVGYDLEKRVFYLHNPSGVYKKSQEYVEISFSAFNRFFAKKGIIID